LLDEQREKNNSFAIETNLADVETWKFLLAIQDTGYEVWILFLSTDNLEVLNNRIRERTRLGDHFVNPEVVSERYYAGLRLLNYYFDKPDRLQLFDNSTDTKQMAEATKGKIEYVADSLPEWIAKSFEITYIPRKMKRPKSEI